MITMMDVTTTTDMIEKIIIPPDLMTRAIMVLLILMNMRSAKILMVMISMDVEVALMDTEDACQTNNL
jgi:hypothetical protein